MFETDHIQLHMSGNNTCSIFKECVYIWGREAFNETPLMPPLRLFDSSKEDG
jgi:hypothetical protein